VSSGAVAASDAIIHGLIMDVAVNAGISAATAAQPWLGIWPISAMFRMAVNYFAGFMSVELQRVSAYAIIDAQANKEAADVKAAHAALEAAHISGDLDAQTKAKEEFKRRLALLVKTH